MPTGPNGQKRLADAVANAVLVGQISTGDAEETHVNAGKSAGGKKGGRARAASMSAEHRREVAKARWG